MDSGFPDHLLGYLVVLNPLLDAPPKLQLSPGFNDVSPEFKAKFNAWLVERFGYKENEWQVLMIGGQMVMGPRTYSKVCHTVGRIIHV